MEKWLSVLLLGGCLLVAVAAQSVDTNVAVNNGNGGVEATSVETVDATSVESWGTSTENLEVNQSTPVDTPYVRAPAVPVEVIKEQISASSAAPAVDTSTQQQGQVDATQQQGQVDATQQQGQVDATQQQGQVDATQQQGQVDEQGVNQQGQFGPAEQLAPAVPNAPHQAESQLGVIHQQVPAAPVPIHQLGQFGVLHQQAPAAPVANPNQGQYGVTFQKVPVAPHQQGQFGPAHHLAPAVPGGVVFQQVPVAPLYRPIRPTPPVRRPVPGVAPYRRPSRPIQYIPSGVFVPDLPFKRDDFRHQVFEFYQNEANPKQFTADCAASTNPYVYQKPGYLIGIWDDKDTFTNVDKVKCLRGGDEDEDDDDSDSDSYEVDDDVYFELDPNQYEDIDLDPKSPNHRPTCSVGYLLTGLTKVVSDYDTAPVVFGHCLKLIRGTVDYNVCEQKSTEAKSGGAFEAYVDWGVECQFGHSAVGVKVDAKRVRSLRCCKLTRSTVYGK